MCVCIYTTIYIYIHAPTADSSEFEPCKTIAVYIYIYMYIYLSIYLPYLSIYIYIYIYTHTHTHTGLVPWRTNRNHSPGIMTQTSYVHIQIDIEFSLHYISRCTLYGPFYVHERSNALGRALSAVLMQSRSLRARSAVTMASLPEPHACASAVFPSCSACACARAYDVQETECVPQQRVPVRTSLLRVRIGHELCTYTRYT